MTVVPSCLGRDSIRGTRVAVWPLILSLIVGLQDVAHAQPLTEPRDPPPEMQRLDFLIGQWTGEGEILDQDGNVTQRLSMGRSGVTYRIDPILNGFVLEGGGGTDSAREWFTYRPLDAEFVWVAVDAQGHFDHLRGRFQGGRLVLTEIGPQPWSDGGTMMFRRTYQEIQDDSHEVLMEISRDEGETWVLYSRSSHRRVR